MNKSSSAMKCGSAILLAAMGFISSASAKDPDFSDLMTVQTRVQNVLDHARKAVVAIECGGGTASGVIVSPAGLILTAAHVTGAPNKKIKITLSDGKTVEGESLGIDTATDAAMVQLPAPAKAWPFVTIQKNVREMSAGAWCFALGNPGGWDALRGSVLRVGKLVKVSSNMLQSDCVLMGGDSGGALFDLNGDLIGINSQIWTGRDQNLHVSMAPFLRSWDALKRGETVSVWEQGSGGWMGVSTQAADNGLRIQAVAPDSPASLAGLKENDVILSVNNELLKAPVDFSTAIRSRAAGELVTLRVKTTQGERLVEVKLGPKPKE